MTVRLILILFLPVWFSVICLPCRPRKPTMSFLFRESSELLAHLFRVITGKVKPSDTNFARADPFKFYNLVKKYDLRAGCEGWVMHQLKFQIEMRPIELFALACEQEPIDRALAYAALLPFPNDNKIPFNSTMTIHRARQSLSVSPTSRSTPALSANPAVWSKAYIQRLGLANYSCYVASWIHVWLAPCEKLQYKSGDEVQREMADEFLYRLRWKE